MADESKIDTSTLSILTLAATFLMGLIDGYTFLNQNGVFVSAQTGNLVAFSSKLFTGQWKLALSHVVVFLGFAFGAFIGEAIVERIQGSVLKKYEKFLIIQFVLLLVLAVSQSILSSTILIFLLGLMSGYELTLFRKIGLTTVNDGIMTGNIKNWMNSFYKFIFDKNVAAKADFLSLSLALGAFVLGVGISSLISNFSSMIPLYVAAAFSLGLVFFVKRQSLTTKNQ